MACCMLVSGLFARRLDAVRAAGPAGMAGSIVHVYGPGVPVVFVHGAGGSKQVWNNQLAFLRGHNHAIAIDIMQRGAPPSGDIGAISEGVGDVEATAQAMNIARFVLVAHSFGAHVAIEYSRRHPEQVAGLLLVDPSGDYRWLPENYKRAWLSRFEDHTRRMSIWSLLLRHSSEETRRIVLEDLAATPEQEFKSIGSVIFTYDPATPYELFQGPKLSVFSACTSKPTGGFAPLPRKCMSGVSHWVMLDAPEKLNRILEEFLARVSRREAEAPREGTVL